MHEYEKEIQSIEKQLGENKRLSHQISNVRMAISLIGILLFIYSLTKHNGLVFWLFICACILFVCVIVYHHKVQDKEKYLKAKLLVIQKRFHRFTNQWSKFNETGEEFLQEDSHTERDLDIFGENSLYQYLCVANTMEGKKILASYLLDQNPNVKTIREREEAVKELLQKQDFSLEFETLSAKYGNNNQKNQKEWYYSFIEYLESKNSLVNPFIYILSFILPMVSALSIYMVYQKIIGLPWTVGLYVLQLMMSYYITYQNRNTVNKVYKFCLSIEDILKMVQYIEKTQFKSNHLKALHKKLLNHGYTSKGIEKLDNLNEAFVVQTNPYVHLVLQTLFMYDIHCLRILEQWKKKYATGVIELFQVIGELEALMSLAIIGIDRTVAFPEIVDGQEPILQGADLYHPLIDYQKVVTNSISAGAGIELITGSNMSGKTTFMRTIGINLILAYAGAPICGRGMKISIMKLFTSMRVVDDVSQGISSFYAEVLRMKSIVDYSKSKKPMLVLIDEIFKGTNSADRIIGAQEIIKGLNKNYIIAFVTTHDFELCRLVEEKEVKGNNHHFMEYYKENTIFFDYKIKKGKCKTTNARYILKMAGLI